MRAPSPLLLLLLLTPATLAAQTFYKCTDPNGTIVYSQEPCGSDATKIETGETPVSAKPGAGDALAEQSEFVRMNDIRRQCDTRMQSIERRYAAEYRRVSSEIADIEKRIGGVDPRLAGSTLVTDLKAQISPLQSERNALQLAESQQRATAQEQCRNELAAEEERQTAARAARAEAARVEAERIEALRAAEEAAARRAAEEKAKADADAAARPDDL